MNELSVDESTSYLIDNQANGIEELMILAFYQADGATLVGQGLEKVINDPAMKKLEDEKIIPDIQDHPGYGTEAFVTDPRVDSIQFGEHGSMWEDAHYEGTWMLRAANVESSATVNENGDITIQYSIEDTLDLRPDWGGPLRKGWRGFAYNMITTVSGFTWHELLGGNDKFTTSANWKKTIKAK